MDTQVTGRIVTVTFSPVLDLSTTTDVVAPTHKLRCTSPVEHAGGGGVNVARVAIRLGAEAVAVAPIGGHTGRRLAELIEGEGLALRSIEVESRTRQSLAVIESTTADQYRFVLPTPPMRPTELELVLHTIQAECPGAASVVVSGRLPDDLSDGVFERIVHSAGSAPVIVDTSGAPLASALRSGVFVAKPSARELAELAGRDLLTESDILRAAIDVRTDSGIEALVVSIGSGGAFLVTEGATTRFRAPSVRVRSAVGAGDSMVAGIAAGLLRSGDLEEAIRLGIAAGTAAVLTEATDLCRRDDVDRLLPLVAREAVA